MIIYVTISGMGSKVLCYPDQNKNDLEKSLDYLYELHLSKGLSELDIAKSKTVIILGAYGGRFDQEIANVQLMYQWASRFQRLVLADHSNISFLLDPNFEHVIRPIRYEGIYEGMSCGLLPLAHRVDSLVTSGLEWNLQDESLELGVRISSSNRIPEKSQEVTVKTSQSIVWTASYKYCT